MHFDPSKCICEPFLTLELLLTPIFSSEQAERDRLEKAVREAEAPKDAMIAQLKKENDKLNHDRLIDEDNLRELSRLHNEYKQKHLDLATYQSHAKIMEELQQKTNQELQELRAKVVKMEILRG